MAGMSPRLLTRDAFRETVLARLGGRCCVPGCAEQADAAHHILNRNLFKADHEFGGYFAENGSGLCTAHHLDAEETRLSTDDLRTWCGISVPVLPEHLADDTGYDTWGNPVLADGSRLPGELFHTDQCQKALRGVLHLFQTQRFKYPRSMHLPFSPGRSDDDKVQHDLTALQTADEIVVTLKQDGENTTFYADGHSHARSVTASPHPSRDHVRALAAMVGPQLPYGWRVCGENMWAVHSIEYRDLPAHFLVFSIWEQDRCLSWDETTEWAELLDLTMVPVIYRGPMLDEAGLSKVFAPYADAHEGYVVRDAAEFRVSDFQQRLVKFVRASHVQTDQHWIHQEMRVNGLAR
jgi:hypothetical protein